MGAKGNNGHKYCDRGVDILGMGGVTCKCNYILLTM